MLRVLQERSVRETAATLHIPEATARTRLFRARKQLRQAFSSTAIPFEDPKCAPS